jgi:hypothetical protein
MGLRASMLRHPIRAALVAVLTVAALAFGVAWFGPQYLFIDRTVDEPPPSASTGTGARGPGAVTSQAGAPRPVVQAGSRSPRVNSGRSSTTPRDVRS